MKRPASSSRQSIRSTNAHRSAGIALLFIVGAFIAIVAACSNQGEGERCEFENGNDDCKTDEGLVCYQANQLNADSDRCCPADRSRSTHPVCKTTTDIETDAQTPADTGPAPITPDATPADPDAAPDAEPDAADAADAADQ